VGDLRTKTQRPGGIELNLDFYKVRENSEFRKTVASLEQLGRESGVEKLRSQDSESRNENQDAGSQNQETRIKKQDSRNKDTEVRRQETEDLSEVLLI
jgi:hypothetical protein